VRNRFAEHPPLAGCSQEEEVKVPPRSDLCPVSIPIHIAWEGRNGDKCAATAKTLLVNRRGAIVILQQRLDPAQEITIVASGVGREARARVIGLIGQESDGQVYGIVLSDPITTPWDAGLARVIGSEVVEREYFLECAACLNPAQIRLDSIQEKVFGARQLITLLCRECNKWTVWGPASCEARPREAPEANPMAASKPAPRTENRRKHGRILTNVSACLRSAGGQLEEVVRVKDISRGGFRFQSPTRYPEGFVLLVAMPFTPNASNVFVRARVMWRREVPRLKRYEYGVAYERTPQRLTGS